MKKIALLLLFSIMYSCGTKYVLENKSILKFEESYFTNWSAGIKGGGSGYNISLKLNDSVDLKKDNTILEGLYFKGKYADLKEQKKGFYQSYVGSKGNIISEKMMPETKEELQEKIPFELKNNEAVVLYKKKGKPMYFKIQLKKKNTIDVPM